MTKLIHALCISFAVLATPFAACKDANEVSSDAASGSLDASIVPADAGDSGAIDVNESICQRFQDCEIEEESFSDCLVNWDTAVERCGGSEVDLDGVALCSRCISDLTCEQSQQALNSSGGWTSECACSLCVEPPDDINLAICQRFDACGIEEEPFSDCLVNWDSATEQCAGGKLDPDGVAECMSCINGLTCNEATQAQDSSAGWSINCPCSLCAG